MSTWMAIENAIVTALSGLEISGQTALATVKAQTNRDRKSLAASIVRERLPAAYLVIGGRDSGDKNYRRAGSVLLTILFACHSDRNDQDARKGGTGVVGVFALAEAVGAVLQDMSVAGSGRLLMVEERSISGADGTALWEQSYEVRTQSGEYRPAFGGFWLVGDASEVQVEIGSLQHTSTTFAFPGVDGVFERFTGTRERPIFWRGQLRASDNEELNTIEQGLEDLIRHHTVQSLEDPWGRTFLNCTARKFVRKGTRQHDAVLGQVVQEFELEFAQLMG